MAVRCGVWYFQGMWLDKKIRSLLNWSPQKNTKAPPVPTPTAQSPQKCQVCLKQQTARGRRVDTQGGGLAHEELEAKLGTDPFRSISRGHTRRLFVHTHTYSWLQPVNTKSQGMALWALNSGFSLLITDCLMTAACLMSPRRKKRGKSQFPLCCGTAGGYIDQWLTLSLHFIIRFQI